MATHNFGSTLISEANAGEYYRVAVCPDGYDSSVVVNFCNQTNKELRIYLLYAPADATEFALHQFLIHNFVLAPHKTYQTNSIALGANMGLFATASDGHVSIQAYGILSSQSGNGGGGSGGNPCIR